MPVLAAFLGMIIRMYHEDHNPPHIHVQYGEFEAIAEIKSGSLLQGRLPPRVHKLLREWLKIRRRDLLNAWSDAQENRQLKRIKPLD